MSETKTPWKPGRKDALFLGMVVLVITLLVMGTSERTTRPTPGDDVHRAVTKHETCVQCHGPGSQHPQPKGHTASVQCFQCHQQPKGWKGSSS